MDDDSVAPSAFYTGLVAELYGPLRSSPVDADPYRRFVQRSGEPALELGCGDGEPLLDLVASGLDVAGLDSSPDMLRRCQEDAVARGLDVTLHCATFETMELGRQFESIYFAGPTFNLLPDDQSAQQALTQIEGHLRPGGSVLIPLFVPNPNIVGEVGRRREHVDDTGVVLSVTVVSADRDEGERQQTLRLRYESEAGGVVEVLERDWILHWIGRRQFASMASDAGLVVGSVRGDDSAFSFILTKPE